MPSSKKQQPTVWVSNAVASVQNIFSIGLGFPPAVYDYPAYYELFWKRTKSQWQDSTVLFTAEDEKKIKAIHESGKELNRTFQHFEKLAVLPEKLWYGLLSRSEKDRYPKERHHIFKVINRGMVVSEGCAQLLQGFRLGETQLAPVRIYRLRNGEPLDDRQYYFLNICEQRRYFRVDASDPAFKQMAHAYYQGQPIYSLKKSIEHDAYALDKAALECDVDLWADPTFWDMIFVSPALREALRKARMDKAWFLYRCQLV